MVSIKSSLVFFVLILCLYPLQTSGTTPQILLSPEEKAWLHENHVVRIRVGSTPPFMITDGEIRGISIDYIKRIFDTNNIKYKFIFESQVTWPQALEYIAQHEVVDMVPTAKITEDRKKRMLFTDEYIFSPWVIFTRSDADFVSSIDDLKGKTVAVEEGFVIHQKLKQDYPEIHLKIASAKKKNFAEIPIKDLSTGLADAYIGNLLSTTFLIQLRGYANIKVAAPTPFDNHNQAMAVRSDWPELVSIINKTLQSIPPEEHTTIRNKWLSVRFEYGISKADLIRWLVPAGSLTLLILGFIAFWNKSLKKEVNFRKIIERDLNESQRIAQIGSWRMNLTTNEVVWSEELYRMYNADKNLPPLPYNEHHKLFTPESWKTLSSALAHTAETGMPYELELETVRKDGSFGWMWVHGEAEKNARGEIIGLWGAAQDISDRKYGEKKLEQTLSYLQNIIDNSPVGIATIKANGQIITTNRALAQIIGGRVEKIIDRNIYNLESWKTSGMLEAADAALASETQVDREVRYTSSFGKDCWVNTLFIPFTHENEKQLLLLLSDISEQKLAEEKQEKLAAQLLQAQRIESIGRLAGGVAHDFNNMLTIILGMTEMLMSDMQATDPHVEKLKEIHNAAERSATLTRQLLAFARKQIIAPRVLNLNDVLSDMLKMLQRLIGEDIDLKWLPADDLKLVKIDPSQVDQIFANLCVNARDAIQSVGKITIETSNVSIDNTYCQEHGGFIPGDYVMIAVSDSGCGMDKATVENIFEPFYTTKEHGEGSGLGLATVYGIVKQNSGFINVYSEPGEGTIFRIYLPQYLETVSSKDTAIQEESLTGSEIILLVEDEETILQMIKTILEGLGYKVLTASKPGDAIETARQFNHRIDLLLTDVVMPEMNGRALANTLSDQYPGLKCLFMSGYTANVIASHGVLESGVHFINKPFTVQALAAKLREVLEE